MSYTWSRTASWSQYVTPDPWEWWGSRFSSSAWASASSSSKSGLFLIPSFPLFCPVLHYPLSLKNFSRVCCFPSSTAILWSKISSRWPQKPLTWLSICPICVAPSSVFLTSSDTSLTSQLTWECWISHCWASRCPLDIGIHEVWEVTETSFWNTNLIWNLSWGVES